MKAIKNIGLILCFIGFAIFTGSIFTGTNKVSQETFNTWAKQKVKSAFFIEKAQKEIVDIELSAFELSHRITEIAKASNIYHKSQKKIAWNKIIPLKWNKTSKDFIYPLARASATGWPQQNEGLFFWITFGLANVGIEETQNEDQRTGRLYLINSELAKIPDDQKMAYLQAVARCPEVVNYEHKIAFLEREGFDVKLAAGRLVRYWKTKLTVFGPEKCFLPLTLRGAMKDEVDGMLKHCPYQLLPVKDTAGRAIILHNPSRRDPLFYSTNSMVSDY